MKKKCHLGILQIGSKVKWSNERGDYLGRITGFVIEQFGVAATITMLPHMANNKVVTIPIHNLVKV